MSVRDLARFGLLYLCGGAWGERQVIPRAWVAQSVQPYALSTDGLGYGYFWEVAVEGRFYGGTRVEPGAFGFSGYPGHYLWVLPERQLVVACQHHLDLPGRETLPGPQFGEVLQAIVAARVR
jgi:CubicO group peptidase (beta-lactamase class C family)